jgi:preprotein translocase subunit SecD
MMKKNYKFLIISLILSIMILLSIIFNSFNSYKDLKLSDLDNNLAFAQNDQKNTSMDSNQKGNLKSKELREKVGKHISKKIEDDMDFWNYLQTNHSNLYNSLNNLKSKYQDLYNHFSFRIYEIYKLMNRTKNNVIKNLLKEKIAIHDKIVRLIYDYKEKKVQASEFENKMKSYIKDLLDNEEKILTERVNEFKAKKDQMAQDMYEKMKEKVDKEK